MSFCSACRNFLNGKYELHLAGNRGFYLASQVKHDQIAVVRSPPFARLSAEHNLRFLVYEATVDVQLEVCSNYIDNRIFHTDRDMNPDQRGWLSKRVILPAGTNKAGFAPIKYNFRAELSDMVTI